MAQVANFCPRCNRFFLELKKHACRDGLMGRSPRTDSVRNKKQCLLESADGEAALSNGCTEKDTCHPSRITDSSYGTLELGQSYLKLLDDMCPSDGNAASSDDPRLELESFLTSNLSGMCLFRLLTADV